MNTSCYMLVKMSCCLFNRNQCCTQFNSTLMQQNAHWWNEKIGLDGGELKARIEWLSVTLDRAITGRLRVQRSDSSARSNGYSFSPAGPGASALIAFGITMWLPSLGAPGTQAENRPASRTWLENIATQGLFKMCDINEYNHVFKPTAWADDIITRRCCLRDWSDDFRSDGEPHEMSTRRPLTGICLPRILR